VSETPFECHVLIANGIRQKHWAFLWNHEPQQILCFCNLVYMRLVLYVYSEC
jgi:hypothetical protein